MNRISGNVRSLGKEPRIIQPVSKKPHLTIAELESQKEKEDNNKKPTKKKVTTKRKQKQTQSKRARSKK